GVYDVVVSRPGRRRVVLAQTFTILGPAVASVDRLLVGAGTLFHVTGAHFGPPGDDEGVGPGRRVTVAGRAVEVLRWTDQSISCVLPAAVPPGRRSVVVESPAGASTESASVIVTPP